METNGVEQSLLEAIKSLYNRSVERVRVLNLESEEYTTMQRVRQGSTVNPLLFILVLNTVMRYVAKNQKRYG